jgi:circadian clock protein KaiC
MPRVLEAIMREIEGSNPAIVIVDSFRSIVRSTLAAGPSGQMALTDFMQRLALALTSYETTSFLIGEYGDGENDGAVFTVADGLLWLYQAIDRNSVVRKLQVIKMRGQGQIPGLHTARIADTGYSVFPRLLRPPEVIAERGFAHRLQTGVPGLDQLMDGGIPRGYSVLVAGPSGSSKTVLSNQFIVEGGKRGENGIVAVFEKRPNDYLQTTPRGEELEEMVRAKKLEVLYLRPLDLSIDETLLELQNAVNRVGAKRAVIDSLSGSELALAPTFRADFRESLYRMMGALTGLGVTVMATVELADSYVELRFSPQGIAFLTDAIIIQRYIEIDGQLRRGMAVVKLRTSQHSKDLRQYEISSNGELAVGPVLKGYEGLLTGTPAQHGEKGK